MKFLSSYPEMNGQQYDMLETGTIEQVAEAVESAISQRKWKQYFRQESR